MERVPFYELVADEVERIRGQFVMTTPKSWMPILRMVLRDGTSQVVGFPDFTDELKYAMLRGVGALAQSQGWDLEAFVFSSEAWVKVLPKDDPTVGTRPAGSYPDKGEALVILAVNLTLEEPRMLGSRMEMMRDDEGFIILGSPWPMVEIERSDLAAAFLRGYYEEVKEIG